MGCYVQLVSRASHQKRNKLNFLFNLFLYVVNAGILHGKSRAVALQREPLRLHAIDLR